jgi:hypothetical protein
MEQYNRAIRQYEYMSQEYLKLRDHKLATILSDTYSIPREDILAIVETLREDKVVVEEAVTEEAEAAAETSSTCVHIMTRGKSIGEECGKKSIGDGLCKTHGKAAKKRKGKATKVKDPQKTSPKKKRLVLRHHPYFTDMFVHKPTGFLIKDKKEGVIGKIKEGKGKDPPTIEELTAEDLVEITKLGMKSKKQ